MRLKEFPFSCNYVADEYLRNKGYRKLIVDNYIVFYLILIQEVIRFQVVTHQGDIIYIRHFYHRFNTCGDGYSIDTKGKYVGILHFKLFHDHFTFEEDKENFKEKVLKKHLKVSVVIDLVSRNTRE